MLAKVLSLKQDDFQGSDGSNITCWKVELDDKTSPVPCYSGEASKLKVGEPLPDGWEVKTSKAGKPYLAVPKPRSGGFGGGGQAAFRNTAEGQRAEQEAIWRSVQFQAERSDRRTALMQAVESKRSDGEAYGDYVRSVSLIAEGLYGWLRQNIEPVAPSVATASGTVERVEGATSRDELSPGVSPEGLGGGNGADAVPSTERPESVDGEAAGSGEQSPGSTLGPGDPESPTDEGGSSGSVGDDVEGVGGSSLQGPHAPPPSPDIAAEIRDLLIKATGSETKARNLLNKVNGTGYSAKTEVHATVEQWQAALAEYESHAA